MNRDRYRTVFCKRLGMLIAVAEIARAQGKGSGRKPGSGTRATPSAPGAASFVLATMSMLSGGVALASPPLPTGGEIVNGGGTISQNGTTLTVNQSTQSLAANWQTFDIDAGHSVVFNQPNSSSVALNRVIGPEASSIYGNLTANGKVFLVNPNGVLFAPGAEVSTGGLVASTLKISDEDFAAGRYRFTDGSNAGSVVNEGSIDAGSVALIGPKIVNNGTISTPGGRTTFAAGDQVTVSLMDGLVTAQVDAAAAGAEILNHGQIIANGGQVHLLAGRADSVVDSLINTDGVIQANSVRSENGKIYLDGGAGGTVYVNGALDASAANEGNGGDVRVLGDRVTLAARATVDVSGQKAGGTVLIGGDYQGRNPETLNARFTAVESGAAIRADGAEQGGRVIVWADNATRFEGKITARGRGFTEVSGKGTLRFSGEVDTGGGTLLLDPPYITVQNTAGDQDSTFSGGQIATLLGSNDVVLNADIDITWNADAALDYNGIGSTTRTLTLQAGNTITFNGSISDSVAGVERLNVVLNADRDANAVGGINIANGASILTSGGDIVLRGGNVALAPLPSFTDPNYSSALGATAAWGVSLGTATLNAGGGNITMRGIGVGGTSNSSGISITGTTVQTSGSGTITLDGIGGAGLNNNRGILTLGAASISTADGALTLQGMGGGTGVENIGVRPNGGTIQTTGSGNLTVNSLGATGSNYNDGFVMDSSAILRVNNGNLSITGTGRGTGSGSDGIELANSSLVEAIGTGSVTFNGSSMATGSDTNRGVTVWLSSTVRTTGGALTLQGASANAANGDAISVEANGTIGGVSQSGAVTLTGDTMNFSSGSIRGSGSLLLQPLTPSATIGLGNGASGTLNLTSAEIGLLQNGFSSILIGRSDSSGAVDVRTAAFLDPVTIRTPAGSGSISVSGTLSTGIGTSSGDITLQAGGNIALSGGTINTATALDLTGSSYTVTGSSTLASNTLAFGNTNGIDNTGTLTLNQASNTTVANNISGASGNLTKAGTNTLALSGANTYGGTTTISAGTLQVGTGGTTGTLGTGAVTNSGTLTFNRSDTVSYSGVLSGSGSLTQAGSGTLVLAGNNTYNGTTTISAGTLQIGNGGTTGTLGTGAVTDDANLVFNRSDTITVANTIGGTGTVTQAGSGTTVLSANNTYSGTTSVNAGTLQVGDGSATGSLGTGAATVNAAGTLRWYRNNNSLDIPNSIGGTGTLSFFGTGAFGQSGYSLSGNNSGFTGPVIVDHARLLYDNANDLGAAAAITVLSGGQLWATADIANAITLNGAGWDTQGALLLQSANASGGINLQSDTRIGSFGTGTVSGVISGAGNLSKSPHSSTLIFTGNNLYTGTTTVMGGTLAITGAAGLGSASGGTSLEGSGILDLRNVALGAETITLNATAGNPVLRASTGPSSFSGNLVLNGTYGAFSDGSHVDVAAGVELTLSGEISGSGGNLRKTGLGTVVLAGNNTYTGPTWVNSGTLAVRSASALGSTSGATRISQGGTLDLRNVALGAETITIDGGLGFATLTASTGPSSLAGNIILGGFNVASNRVAAAAGVELTLSGEISGTRALAKTDAGTVILNGNNTYTGTTTVSAGTLQVGNDGTTGTLGAGAVTNNANLVFNRSDSTSLGTLAAGGISGTGNVTALIGGDFNVDRAIALSGTNSSILLEAGKGVPAGTVAGGDVTLSSNVSTSATGTLAIFSGNATTGAYEAMVSGANGPMRYKTYGASAGNTAGAVTGTRNYYYRQQPSTVTVSGLTATKVYDGLLDASAVVDSSGAIINGTLDGDTLSFSDFTLAGASFDSAHAGTRGLNVSFSGTSAYTGSGNWSVSGAGYTLGNYFNATAGTITPKTISAGINPVGKTYDGLTGTLATLSPTGFVGNDNASGVTGFLLAFDDPNAGARSIVATGTTGELSGFSGAASGNGSGIGTGNEVAGLASDYAVAAPTPVSAIISRAPLTITANNDAKIITQTDAAGYNGASYSGFVNGETSADLTGTLSITRSNSGTEAAGTYTGVLVPTGYTSGNYEITYTNGNFRILPAEQLLVRLQNVSTSYGTAANYMVTSAEYLDGSGATLRTLTQTTQNGNTYTFSDGLGGSITFTVAPDGAVISSAGHLSAGNYTLSGTNASVTGSNFNSANYVGNQTVSRIGVTPVSGVSKVYDGTTSMAGLTLALSGQASGDAVWGNPSGAFLSRNAGTNLAYDINNITLGGADAGNYYLTVGGFSGIDGIILPREITVGGIVAHNKVYDGTTAATLTTAGATLNDVVAGDSVAIDDTSFSALFANKHAGTGKAVTVGGFSLSGAEAGNYTLRQPTGLTASISPAPLTVAAVTNSKIYDGTTSAGATPLVTNGVLMADDRFTALFEQYDSPRVGLGRTLSPLVTIEDGNGGANYAVTLVSNTTGEILPGIDMSQVGGTNTTAKLNASIGDHRRRRELDEEHLLPSVRVIATGLRLPEGITAAGLGDFGDFAN